MITIVVPCFNEAARLEEEAFAQAALAHPEWRFLFVNDGSSDDTQSVLERVCERRGDRFSILRLATNSGKGEAVRLGLLAALRNDGRYVGFVDADLSAPISEVNTLLEVLDEDPHIHAALGARVRRLGADIQRSPIRHITGRAYATAAAVALSVGVYDTQCGAKVFRITPELHRALSVRFRERWAFDVEFLSRLATDYGWESIAEVPLHTWHERQGSTLGAGGAAMAGMELLRIGVRHRSRKRGRPG